MQPYKPVKELKVEDALMYLDQVKVEFSEKPHIYNEFLEIMKNFKTQAINTPGVIERVKNLFRGYNKLILGFNTFLPEGEGYKIELTAEEEAQSFPGQSTIAVEPPPAPAPEQIIPAGFKPPGQQMQQQHAISYVTTIRNRFSDQPETYRSFLRILHTYQKEQRGIKDVLEQVSTLFADHPDLLMEFTYFLPDAVQDQAKERLARAANDAKAKKAKQEAALLLAQQKLHAIPITLPSSSASSQLPSSNLAAHAPPTKRKEREPPRALKEEKGDRDRDQHRDRDRDRDRDQHRDRERPSIMAPMHPLPPLGSVTVPTAVASSTSSSSAIPPSGMPSATSAATTAAAVRKANKKRIDAQAPPPPHSHSHPRESEAKMMMMPHSINAERKFFDQIKVALSVTREGWSEFLKYLELFITNVVSKKEMYNMLRELLEATPTGGTEILQQFKKMLMSKTAIDSSSQEVWFGLPLSEIDFHQCRVCTPSYRALPEDFPVPVCSVRGELEKEVLNDKWVSIPIGSEESYSFKHMRKNQYEEILFKCEDERFEIDMVIDSNTATIKLLEPLNEEIQIIKMAEVQDAISGANSSNSHSNANSNAPLTRLHFKLERKNIGPVHIAAISRIYGENGPEIIDMLFKNPVGAIPVILKRLKQKDAEWKKARLDLNKQWKESQEKNFDRSLDHRSFYFRQQDKKSYSARMLVSEIKTIAETSSQFDLPPPPVAPVSSTSATGTKDLMVDKNVMLAVPPAVQALAPDMKPHIAMTYPHEDKAILQDAYSIMTFAAESSSMNASDKERVSALWRDLLRIFFNMPVHFLYRAATTASSSSAAASSGNGNNGSDSPPSPIDVAEAYPLHSRVLTIYGPAEVLGFRSFDSLYKVSLAWGTGYFHSTAVIGSEHLTIPALQAIGVTRDSHGREIIVNVPPSDNELRVMPPCEVLYGTQICYVFVKMHHTLCTRLALAKKLATEITQTDKAEEIERQRIGLSDVKTKTATSTTATATAIVGSDNTTLAMSKIKPLYSSYLSQLMGVIDGSLDSNRYEEVCRQLLGHHSYPLYTLDKIVHQILKCLQVMSNDESVNKLVGLYMYHRQRSGGLGVDPKLYRKHVAQVLSHNLEDVYRIQYVTETVSSHKKESKSNAAGSSSKIALSQNPWVRHSYVLCQSLGVLSSGMTPVSSAARMNQMMELIPDAEEEEEEEEEDEEEDVETEADTEIMHHDNEGSVSSDEEELEDDDEEEDEEETEPATASKASSDPTLDDDHSLPPDHMEIDVSAGSRSGGSRDLRGYAGRADTRDSGTVAEDEEEDIIDEEIAASAEGFSCMLAAAGELAQLDSDYRSEEFDFQYSPNASTNTAAASNIVAADHANKSRAFIANQMIGSAGDNSSGPSSGDQPRHPSHTTTNNNSSSSTPTGTTDSFGQRGVKRGLQEISDTGTSSVTSSGSGSQNQETDGSIVEGDRRGMDPKSVEQRFRY